jgi:dethiobiotin synthetase
MAGGVLSPISADATMADFISYYKLPTILVSHNYLGSINHTLLSIEVLKSRNIQLLGIVMCGESNRSSESFIEAYSQMPILAHIPHFDKPDYNKIMTFAATISGTLKKVLADY